jgi:hypothetical protein
VQAVVPALGRLRQEDKKSRLAGATKQDPVSKQQQKKSGIFIGLIIVNFFFIRN